MQKVVVTGAAGFIPSYLISDLISAGKEVIAVDDLNKISDTGNLDRFDIETIDREMFRTWLDANAKDVEIVIHLGARTDTTEFNVSIFNKLNYNYSIDVWRMCVQHGLPLVYASSGATYGLGEYGYKDDEDIIPKLKPLNPYGESKNNFDIWALEQEEQPPYWIGLKFFNVYGPNEYHKGRMASVIFHAFRQITKTGGMKLFRSHNPNYKDGEQMRDFVYVGDISKVIQWLMLRSAKSGIYNLGSGKARTFLDLVKNTFKAMGKEENISFIDTPIDIRDKYQYFTEADMEKLKGQGYPYEFRSLEEGVHEYVADYLMQNDKKH